jgi:hypothetical protein
VRSRDRCLLAAGISQNLLCPRNRFANSRSAGDPALQKRISIIPEALCRRRTEKGAPEAVTTADVLEAIHEAAGLNLMGDYFTRFYLPESLPTGETSLGEALHRLSDAMQMRWHREDDLLQFRSAGFFHDRLTEIPHRLLSRWAESRCKMGTLSFEDLIEAASLSDAQLDAPGNAEGAKALYGLEEWDLVHSLYLRPHWRFLSSLPPALRSSAWSPQGLQWEHLPFAQQQQFLALATYTQGLERREHDLAHAALQETLMRIGQETGPWRAQDLAEATLHVVNAGNDSIENRKSKIENPTPAYLEQDIAFIYRYGSREMGFWRREIRSNGTAWSQDPFSPLALF